MLRVKELKQMLEECDDNDYVALEYVGYGLELDCGDTFVNIHKQDVELNKNNITIVFN